MQFRFEEDAGFERCSELRQSVRAFLAREKLEGRLVPRPNCWLHYDAEFSRRCGNAGFIGITFPREYGGRCASALERFVICEEMLAAGAPVAAHWTADRQSGPQILKHGSETAKRAILPAIAAGRCCVGIGMSEPNAGSDLAAVRTRAERVSGGWTINGAKLWTSNAHRADYVIALVRTGAPSEVRHDGLTQLIVDMRSSGITTSPIRDMTGGNDFDEVHFSDVFVSDEFVLGVPGGGWRLVTGELAYERSGPERYMSTFVVFEELIARIGQRPTNEQCEAVGRLVAEFLSLRRMSCAIASLLERGESPDTEAALVKDLGAQFERDTIETARRLYPLQAVPEGTEDRLQSSLADAMLAAPSFTLRGGTREILRGIVAKGLGVS